MPNPPHLFDRPALLMRRARAVAQGPALFLHEEAAVEIEERLKDINRTFTAPAIVTGFPAFWGDRFGDVNVVADDEILDLPDQAHDLVIHAMCLHQANDPVGQLVQCQRALKPDGLLIVAMFGGQTLTELRAAISRSEVSITGGLSPRVAPMAEIRDAGALLQRAGFAMPVADNDLRRVSYASTTHLMQDLRAMGETNVLSERHRSAAKRDMFAHLALHYPTDGDRITATFEMLYLTGWAPDASQPKALRPGSAKTRLAEALNTTEYGEDAKPQESDDA